MRDLRADWQRWTPSERILGLLTLTLIFIAVSSLPYLVPA
jgi:hypothetical protein